MTLNEYYDIILDKLQKGDYKILVNKKFNPPDKSQIKVSELPLQALNYMIYEYLKDHKDKRFVLLFEYVLIPKDVNKEGCDIDFTKVKFDDFVEFMISVKT